MKEVKVKEKKKETYEKPEVEVIEFDTNEIMTLSSALNDGIYEL